ncbi:MAG: hypothetical protein QM831_37180 [Kofleriaceae bacterium]
MRGGIAIAFAAGCSFSPGAAQTGSGDDSMIDAPASIDAPVCVVQTDASTTASNAIGNPDANGAVELPPLACQPDEVIIGAAFFITPNNPPGMWNQRVATATRLICGHLTRSLDGAYHVMRSAMTPETAQASCNMWMPGVLSNEALCADGQVVVGVTANEAQNNGGQHSMFDNISLQCATLDPQTAAPIQPYNTVQMMNTGGGGGSTQTASCSAGTIASSFDIYRGCGEDALILRCAAPACM